MLTTLVTHVIYLMLLLSLDLLHRGFRTFSMLSWYMKVLKIQPVVSSALESQTVMSTCRKCKSIGEVRSLLGPFLFNCSLTTSGFLTMVACQIGLPLRKGMSFGVASVKSNLKVTVL